MAGAAIEYWRGPDVQASSDWHMAAWKGAHAHHGPAEGRLEMHGTARYAATVTRQGGGRESRMLHPHVQQLLDTIITTPIKLQLLLLFVDFRGTHGSVSDIVGRIFRDPWITEASLKELSDDGILSVDDSSGQSIYRYQPRSCYIPLIARLATDFNDPLARDAIYRRLT
jgi:hypothetical protein